MRWTVNRVLVPLRFIYAVKVFILISIREYKYTFLRWFFFNTFIQQSTSAIIVLNYMRTKKLSKWCFANENFNGKINQNLQDVYNVVCGLLYAILIYKVGEIQPLYGIHILFPLCRITLRNQRKFWNLILAACHKRH